MQDEKTVLVKDVESNLKQRQEVLEFKVHYVQVPFP